MGMSQRRVSVVELAADTRTPAGAEGATAHKDRGNGCTQAKTDKQLRDHATRQGTATPTELQGL